MLAQINVCITLNVHWSTGLATLVSSARACAEAALESPKELFNCSYQLQVSEKNGAFLKDEGALGMH